jgi:hypothetical protein
MEIEKKIVEVEEKLKKDIELYQQFQKQMQELGNEILAEQGAVKALKEVVESGKNKLAN